MWSTIMTLIPMVLEYTMVVSEYLVTKYLIMLIQARKSGSRTHAE